MRPVVPTGQEVESALVTKRYLPGVAAAVLAGAAALSLAEPAQAQTIRSPYDFIDRGQTVHAFATYVFTDQGTLGVGPESAPAVGIGWGIRVSGPFAFDTRVAYMPTSRTVYDLDPAADPDAIRDDPTVGLVELGSADLSLLLLDASLRFNITGSRTWHRLQPYALLGAGLIFRMGADHAAEDELSSLDLRVRFRNGVTGHVGGGVEWHLSDRFSMRFDARDVLWRLHIAPGFITPARVIDDREWVQTAHLSVGAAFRF
jgi:hypothetical protein